MTNGGRCGGMVLTLRQRTDSALIEVGNIVCWGFNQRGQLAVPADLRAAQISAGYDISCALTIEGRIRCWGALDDPPEELQARGFVDLDVGHEHACATTVERRVYCWPPSPTAAPEALAVR